MLQNRVIRIPGKSRVAGFHDEIVERLDILVRSYHAVAAEWRARSPLNAIANPQKCARAYLSALLFLKLTIPLVEAASLITTYLFHCVYALAHRATTTGRGHDEHNDPRVQRNIASRATTERTTRKNVLRRPRFRTDWRGATLRGRSTPTRSLRSSPPPPVSNYSVPATAGQLTFFCCHSSFVSYDNLSSRSDITETQVVHGHVCLLASRPPSMPTENIFPLPNQRSTTSDDFFEQRQQQRNVAPCWFDGGMAKVSKLKEDAVSSYWLIIR